MWIISSKTLFSDIHTTAADDATYHILECLPGSLQVVQVGAAALHGWVAELLEPGCPAERAVTLGGGAQRQRQPKQGTLVAEQLSMITMGTMGADRAMNTTHALNKRIFPTSGPSELKGLQPSSVCLPGLGRWWGWIRC